MKGLIWGLHTYVLSVQIALFPGNCIAPALISFTSDSVTSQYGLCWPHDVRWQHTRSLPIYPLCCILLLFSFCYWIYNIFCLACLLSVFPARIFFFGRVACEILVPRPGIEPMSPALEVQSLNHWTTREVPIPTKTFFFFSKGVGFLLLLLFIIIIIILAALGLRCCVRAFSSCGERASHCSGFSCCDLWALELRLSSCGSWALECSLSSCGARA